MKVLIQNPMTLSYLAGDSKWTRRSEEAVDFSESRKAAAFCFEHRLLDMQIVLKFPDPRYDVQMPAWAAVPRQTAGVHPAPASAFGARG